MDDGFEAPVYRSLAEPMRIGGLPRNVAIGLWGFAAGLFAIHMTVRNLWVFPGAAVVHGVLAMMTRNDPDFILVCLRAMFASPLFLARTRLLARERRIFSGGGWSLYGGRRLEP